MVALSMMSGTQLSAQGTTSPIIGRWHYQGPAMEIVADFNADGTLHQITRNADGEQTLQGRYSLDRTLLYIQPFGTPMVQTILCQFQDTDTMILTYPTGQVLMAKRVQVTFPDSAMQPENPTEPTVQDWDWESNPDSDSDSDIQDRAAMPPSDATRPPSPAAMAGSTHAKPPRIFLQRAWEPNERAFTVLVPKGWQIAGGIFNVNPFKTNGPGNTLSPKCDFSVKSDAAGTVMLRWMPSWNYADLSRSPSGYTLFKPGQYYQGMLVKPMLNARQFITEMLRTERPHASDMRVMAEDPMPEVTDAFTRQAEPVNSQLRRMGISPLCFESLAMLVEYHEAGRRFREGIMTVIADNRSGAFQWSNENTVMFRAPADGFAGWKPILDMIRVSREPNPQWLAAVQRASGERAKRALETQQYINRVANEIVENRARTHAEMRHEQWLFISGQEEYKNPFTGEIERGTSAYRYRWENNQGEIFYSDENSFDPNRYEEYNTREWKRSEVWDRRKP